MCKEAKDTVFLLGGGEHKDVLLKAKKEVEPNLLLTIAMEELAELIQQVSKSIRNKEDQLHLAKEFADVLIALDFIRMSTKIKDKDIVNWYEYKIKRMKDKLESKNFK